MPTKGVIEKLEARIVELEKHSHKAIDIDDVIDRHLKRKGIKAALLNISDAPATCDIIIIDNHGFAYRARRTQPNQHNGCWTIQGRNYPTFKDSDLDGWVPLPEGE